MKIEFFHVIQLFLISKNSISIRKSYDSILVERALVIRGILSVSLSSFLLSSCFLEIHAALVAVHRVRESWATKVVKIMKLVAFLQPYFSME